MKLKLRAVHWLVLATVALLTAVFHGIAGFPVQVALGLALLTWVTVDFVDPGRRRR